MKILLLAVTLTISFSSLADSYYKPKNMSCQELQDAVENYRVIGVVYGALGFSRAPMFANQVDADRRCRTDVIKPSFKTLDQRYCVAGYMCKRRSRHHD